MRGRGRQLSERMSQGIRRVHGPFLELCAETNNSSARMCGIAGFIDARAALGAERLAAIGSAMATSLRHRGPDDSGVWVDRTAGISLAHRRLAILDLSPAGRQPMLSSCGRFVLVYNGEIYNYAELRLELAASGRVFRGHSDSEVLVEACAHWGVAEL